MKSVSNGRNPPPVWWADRIAVEGDRYRKRMVLPWTDGPVATCWADLFSMTAASPQASVDVSFVYAHTGHPASELKPLPRRLWLNLDRPTRVATGPAADLLRSFRLPNDDRNPFLLCESNSGHVVVDTIALLRAVVAPNARTFEVLLSPFRELAISAHRSGPVVLLDVDQVAFRHMRKSSGSPTANWSKLPRDMAQAFAYWMADPHRLASLTRVGDAIRSGSELVFPPMAFDTDMQAFGWQHADLYLIQHLLPFNIRTSWWLDPAQVIVVARRGTDIGWRISKSYGAALEASFALFGDDSLLPEKLSTGVVRRLRDHMACVPSLD